MPKLTEIIADLYAGTSTKEDAVTAATTTFQTWRHNSTGTPAASFGIRHLFQLESDTTTNQDAAAIDVVWRVATHATRGAQMIFNLVDQGNALAPAIYFDNVSVSLNSGSVRNPGLGIGTVPARPLHVKFTTDAATTICAYENNDSTNDNGIVQSFRTLTSGVGGAANQELAGFRVIFREHNHATRQAGFEIFLNNAGTYEVFKFRNSRLFGYGDTTWASFTQLLGTRKTGWAVATGTATRTTFDTASVTLPQLAERVKALIDDLHQTAGHGLIGT